MRRRDPAGPRLTRAWRSKNPASEPPRCVAICAGDNLRGSKDSGRRTGARWGELADRGQQVGQPEPLAPSPPVPAAHRLPLRKDKGRPSQGTGGGMSPWGIAGAVFFGNSLAGAAIGPAQAPCSRDEMKMRRANPTSDARPMEAACRPCRACRPCWGRVSHFGRVGGSGDRVEVKRSESRVFQSIWPVHDRFSTIKNDTRPASRLACSIPSSPGTGARGKLFSHRPGFFHYF